MGRLPILVSLFVHSALLLHIGGNRAGSFVVGCHRAERMVLGGSELAGNLLHLHLCRRNSAWLAVGNILAGKRRCGQSRVCGTPPIGLVARPRFRPQIGAQEGRGAVVFLPLVQPVRCRHHGRLLASGCRVGRDDFMGKHRRFSDFAAIRYFCPHWVAALGVGGLHGVGGRLAACRARAQTQKGRCARFFRDSAPNHNCLSECQNQHRAERGAPPRRWLPRIAILFLPRRLARYFGNYPCSGAFFSGNGHPDSWRTGAEFGGKSMAYFAPRKGIPPVAFHLHKQVPIGAGLGGGSADGAFALKALNDYFALGYSDEALRAFAKQLGSDCPFFISNEPRYVTGTGDVFEDLALDLRGSYLVLCNPGIHIGTREAYAGIVPQAPLWDTREVLEGDKAAWRERLHNDFENHLFEQHSELAALKQAFYDAGAWYASMTGSGSTVFGLFDREVDFQPPIEGAAIWKGFL